MQAVLIRVVLVLIGSGSICIAFVFGRQIPFSEQWPLFEALRTTASIIFAVVGAWLAIIYPERLKFSFRGGDKPTGRVDQLGTLLTPAIHSTAILALILVIGVAAPVLRRLPILLQHLDACRGMSYAILVALTEWQLMTVFLTLIPADAVKTSADLEEDKRRIHESYRA